jgi:hypothetical protein
MARFTFIHALLGTATVAFGMVCAPSTASAQQGRPTVEIHDDDITIRGCVGHTPTIPVAAEHILVWTRGNIMLSQATSISAGKSQALRDRVFYWLDDEEDLAKHVGQLIEVRGDIEDFEKGELTITREGDFTDIKLDLGGKTEKARVPTSWLGASASEGEFDLVARKIHVDDVKVLDACNVK